MKVDKDRLDAATAYFNSKLSFIDYLEKYNLMQGSVPTNQGVAICCPFHGDKDPSFKIDTDRNLFKCFGCGADGGGNLIKFIAKYETEILGRRIAYSKVIENLLKSNRQFCVDLGFNSVYDTSYTDINSIRTNGLKRFKLKKDSPMTFLELSNYIKKHGTVDDMMSSIKLMQEGLNADIIYNMMFKVKVSTEFVGMSVDELLKED